MNRAKPLIALAAVAILIILAAVAFTVILKLWKPKKPELLGVYVYMYEFPSRDVPKNWDGLLDKFEMAGARIILPFVIDAYGYAYFNSSIVPINYEYFKRYKGEDPLQDLIRKAHERGLKVYAWVVVGRVSRSVLEKHPDWAVYNVNNRSCLEDAPPRVFSILTQQLRALGST